MYSNNAKKIPPQRDTEIRSSKNPGYPSAYGSWTGRSDAFKKLAGKIPSGYTKDVLDYLDALQLASWRRGETFDHIPAETWQHRWTEVCQCGECKKRGVKSSVLENHVLSTPAIDPKQIADKLGCSVRTVQNSLSEAWEIGCTARRKVGKRYAYTILFEDFHRVQKQAEPEPRRGPIVVRHPKPDSRPGSTDEPSELDDQKLPGPWQLVPDQASRFRLEFETVAGEQTAIRVIEIGEDKGNGSRNLLRGTTTQPLDSIENCNNSETLEFDTALRELRARTREPLRYTTVCHEDYIQVTISAVSGVFCPLGTPTVCTRLDPNGAVLRVNMQPQQKGVMPTAPETTRPNAPTPTGIPVGQAAGRPDHAAILAAIPKKLILALGKPGPVLLDRIAANLEDTPISDLTAKIRSDYHRITKIGLIANFAKDVCEARKAVQGRPDEPEPAKKPGLTDIVRKQLGEKRWNEIMMNSRSNSPSK